MTSHVSSDPAALVAQIFEKLMEYLNKNKQIIHVMQFNSNLLYLPVYLLFNDVRIKTNNRVVFKYENKGTDIDAREAVASYSKIKINHKKIPPSRKYDLVIGISELTDEYRNDPNYLEQPFIKRLPLWGIALANNQKINLIKSNEKQARHWSTRLRFWKTFGGKLSLLRKEDLTNEHLRLSASLYSTKTTARRLFDEYLGGDHMDYVSEVDAEHEFDDLFDGHVDIALTVQPWVAVQNAKVHGHEIEVVYVHQGQPQPFSSVYLYEDDHIYRAMLEPLLQAINLGVRHYIHALYGMEWVSETRLKEYKKTLKQLKIGIDNESLECALDMICDSRIYYYEMTALGDKSATQKNLLTEFEMKHSDWWFNTHMADSDVIYEISKIIDKSEPTDPKLKSLKTHPNTELNRLVEKDGLHKLIWLASYYRHPITESFNAVNFVGDWRCDTFASFFEKNWMNQDYSKGLWTDPGRMKGPWIPKAVMHGALHHFACQFTQPRDRDSSCEYVSFKSGFHNINNNNLILWVLIEYMPIANGVVFYWEDENGVTGFKNSKFCSADNLDRNLFDAWWIKATSNEIYNIQNDRKLNYLSPVITCGENGKCKVIIENKGPTINNCNYALLIAFKISSTDTGT